MATRYSNDPFLSMAAGPKALLIACAQDVHEATTIGHFAATICRCFGNVTCGEANRSLVLHDGLSLTDKQFCRFCTSCIGKFAIFASPLLSRVGRC